MKPQYQHLKLIIECPTQEAWEKVTEIFGLQWDNNHWGFYKRKTSICIPENTFSPMYFYKRKREYKEYEFLTHPQFCERFLNQDEEEQSFLIKSNKGYFDRVRDLVYELVQSHAGNKNDVLEIERELQKIISEETRDYTPLPFGEYKPNLRVHDEDVTVYERVSVNEDVLISE